MSLIHWYLSTNSFHISYNLTQFYEKMPNTNGKPKKQPHSDNTINSLYVKLILCCVIVLDKHAVSNRKWAQRRRGDLRRWQKEIKTDMTERWPTTTLQRVHRLARGANRKRTPTLQRGPCEYCIVGQIEKDPKRGKQKKDPNAPKRALWVLYRGANRKRTPTLPRGLCEYCIEGQTEKGPNAPKRALWVLYRGANRKRTPTLPRGLRLLYRRANRKRTLMLPNELCEYCIVGQTEKGPQRSQEGPLSIV